MFLNLNSLPSVLRLTLPPPGSSGLELGPTATCVNGFIVFPEATGSDLQNNRAK